jgi:hypothetical protein
MSKDDNSGKGGGHDDDVTLTVATPRGVFTAGFDKNAKVSDVIDAAIEKKKLSGAPADFELFKGDEALTPTTRTLVSFHLNDGDKLVLAAQGEGV